MVSKLVGDTIPRLWVISGSLKWRLYLRKRLRGGRVTASVKSDVYDERLPDSPLQRALHLKFLGRAVVATLMLTVRHPWVAASEISGNVASAVLAHWVEALLVVEALRKQDQALGMVAEEALLQIGTCFNTQF
jgi:hypothetical protein